MKAKALEIRWHDTQPIFSADFHSISAEKHRKILHPYAASVAGGNASASGTTGGELPGGGEVGKDNEKLWRLATAGGDKLIRLWLVHPRPPVPSKPLSVVPSTSKLPAAPIAPPQLIGNPTVEYLATLKQHTGVVNVVRFSPVGEMLASAGDDGVVLIWIPTGLTSTFGEDAEDRAFEREAWRVKSMVRGKSGAEIYDIAWSPNGQHILTGSVDHSANIYDVSTGQLLHTISEHTNYVQGVAWDPRNHYIATQSSDRSMHIYSLAHHANGMQVHAVGKNSRMQVQHKPGGSWSGETKHVVKGEVKGKEKEYSGSERPSAPKRSASHASESDRSEASSTRPSLSHHIGTSEEPTLMDPPAFRPTSSRNSSTSGSQTSPALQPQTLPQRYLRSPSPAPLPAVMAPPSPTLLPSTSVKLYGDANSTPFFRRLAWSTDGSLLLTPAGLFEDPYAGVGSNLATTSLPAGSSAANSTPAADGGKKKSRKNPNPTPSNTASAASVTTSGPRPTVYIYSRTNVARPPIAHLPGHKTTSIAIRFCPVLWELRKLGGEDGDGDDCVVVDLHPKGIDVKLAESSAGSTEKIGEKGEAERPKSLFDLPYRMVYAVATLDAVFLYDTQQAGPICMFGNLHYAPFTDLTWSADGETLVVSSQDGYCSIVAFDPLELGTPYKSSEPILTPPPFDPPPPLPSTSTAKIPAFFGKVPDLDLTKSGASSIEGQVNKRTVEATNSGVESTNGSGEPVKKKSKRAELKHMGPIGS